MIISILDGYNNYFVVHKTVYENGIRVEMECDDGELLPQGLNLRYFHQIQIYYFSNVQNYNVFLYCMCS